MVQVKKPRASKEWNFTEWSLQQRTTFAVHSNDVSYTGFLSNKASSFFWENEIFCEASVITSINKSIYKEKWLSIFRKLYWKLMKVFQFQVTEVPDVWPRHFSIRPDGKSLWLVEQHKNLLQEWIISPENGSVTLGQEVASANNPAFVIEFWFFASFSPSLDLARLLLCTCTITSQILNAAASFETSFSNRKMYLSCFRSRLFKVVDSLERA